MKVLFVHQNFPAQFKHLAPALAAAGHEVVALTLRRQAPTALKGVRVVTYAVTRGSSRGIHPWAGDFETKVIRGEACFRAALQLRDKGFSPDVIVAHPGWGERTVRQRTTWDSFVNEMWATHRNNLPPAPGK